MAADLSTLSPEELRAICDKLVAHADKYGVTLSDADFDQTHQEFHNGLLALDELTRRSSELHELREALVWWMGDGWVGVRASGAPGGFHEGVTDRRTGESLADLVLRGYRQSQKLVSGGTR